MKRSMLAVAMLLSCAIYMGAQQTRNGDDMVPTGKGWGEKAANSSKGNASGKSRTTCANGICYHGGPVMTATKPNIYYIWYGNWSGNSAVTLLEGLITGLSGSNYEHINTTYYNGSGTHVSGELNWGGSASEPSYPHGTSLSDSTIQTIVAENVGNFNGGKPDTNGIYFVLTSADVNETSGFCTQYCGWHTHGTIDGADLKWAFVGNPDRCPSACEEQTSSSPNNNTGADGMASVIAHEQEEAISDPDLNAWYDRQGAENADKCAWTFGTESTASNGSLYNVSLSGTQYLIQQNWVNAGGGSCAMSY